MRTKISYKATGSQSLKHRIFVGVFFVFKGTALLKKNRLLRIVLFRGKRKERQEMQGVGKE